jgi:hypothetical protein
VSVKVSSWVWHGDETSELAGNEMILLLALADVADDNGRCRFMTDDDDLTYAGLARKARIDRSTAIRVIARLRSRGLIEQEKGARGRPNEFAIVVPWRKGGDLPPVEKVASATEKVASGARKGGIDDTHSSYRRIDVDVPPVVPAGDAVDEAFDRLWEMWPPHRRGTRKKSGASFRTAVRAVGGIRHVDVILDAAEVHASVWRSWPPSDAQFVPAMTTWLNQERWTAEAPMPRGSRLTTVDAGRAADAILAQQERRAVSA